MSRQSVGVVPFKHLIAWCFPRAVAAFDSCAAQHDKDYKTVDWSLGDKATEAIDGKFHDCCIRKCQYPDPNGGMVIDTKLCEQADLFYDVCRAWGRMRAALWRIGVRY